MLNTGVFALGVFTNENGVDVVVGGFVTGNGFAGPDIGEGVEGAAEGEVERDMAFSDRGLGDISLGFLRTQNLVMPPRVLSEQRGFS